MGRNLLNQSAISSTERLTGYSMLSLGFTLQFLWKKDNCKPFEKYPAKQTGKRKLNDDTEQPEASRIFFDLIVLGVHTAKEDFDGQRRTFPALESFIN